MASSTNAWTVLPASISEASSASMSAGEVAATCAASALATADELLTLGDEVRLALQLEQHAGGVVVGDQGDDGTVLGRAALALGDALLALDAQDLDGLVDVAVGLVERLLAVHHAGGGELAELLDVSGGEVRHGL